MKKFLIILAVVIMAIGCSESDNVTGDGDGYGEIVVKAFDNPPPVDVENIFLTIIEVSVHSSEEGWVVISEPDSTFDFLELINGTTAVLADNTLKAGQYSQMRLLLADSNEIVIDGESFPLKVPSGSQSGVKLNLDFTVVADQLIEIYVDFDAAHSITMASDKYILLPSFRAFKEVLSGTLSGTVTDTLGSGIENATVSATSPEYSTSTITDSIGMYKLILPEGDYDISANAAGYTSADTVYSGITLTAGTDLTGFDFTLE